MFSIECLVLLDRVGCFPLNRALIAGRLSNPDFREMLEDHLQGQEASQ
jgi:hypothetical protein